MRGSIYTSDGRVEVGEQEEEEGGGGGGGGGGEEEEEQEQEQEEQEQEEQEQEESEQDAHPCVHEFEAAEELAHDNTDLVHGKVVSNAVAVAHRERDPRIRVNLLVEKALRAEFLWVLPHQRVVVEQQHVQVNWVMVRKGTERKGKERKGKEGKKM